METPRATPEPTKERTSTEWLALVQKGYLRRWPLSRLHLYPGFPVQVFISSIAVVAEGNGAFYSSVNEYLSTEDTGRVCAVDGATLETNAMKGSLDDDILFGMNCPADLLPLTRGNPLLIAEATQLKAVFQTSSGPIITSGQDMLVPDSNSSHMVSKAGGALRHHRGYLEEIVIKTQSFHILPYTFNSLFGLFTQVFQGRLVDNEVVSDGNRAALV